MKIMKKRTMFTMMTAAAITAAMMSGTMSASAVATFPASEDSKGVVALETSDNQLTFHKDIMIHNDIANAVVYGPNITYTYSAAPATVGAGTTVKDDKGNSTHVKQGVSDSVSFTDPEAEFTSESSVTLAGGKYIATDGVTLAVALDKFSSAGIYRYEITETVDAADLTAASITRDSTNYSAKRYLDVYIKNGTSGLEVAGYVMFHASESDISFDASTNPKVNTQNKTDGFDADDNSTTSSSTQNGGNMADHYYTYNYEVDKTIKGDLADKLHEFPFTIQANGAAATPFTVEAAGHAHISGDATTGAVNTALNATIADGGSVKLIGLPADVTIAVTETNDTGDEYKSYIQNPAKDSEASKHTLGTADTNKTYGFTAENLTNYSDNKTSAPAKLTTWGEKTTFTNTLDSISPTGVVMMVAPYAIMLAAAGFFILVFLKNRRKDESAGTI